jgi:hypothetical protein
MLARLTYLYDSYLRIYNSFHIIHKLHHLLLFILFLHIVGKVTKKIINFAALIRKKGSEKENYSYYGRPAVRQEPTGRGIGAKSLGASCLCGDSSHLGRGVPRTGAQASAAARASVDEH